MLINYQSQPKNDRTGIEDTDVTPKRILMSTDTVGGVWTYALELARALLPYGVEVALATMGRPLTPEQWNAAKAIPKLEVFESNFKLEWMEDAWEDVRLSGEWLLDLEERIQPDVVHLNSYGHGALPWRSPILIVGHSCVLSWWEAVKGEPAPPSWDRYRQEVKRGLQAANLVVTPSASMLAALNKYYGSMAQGRVVPNGCDRNTFNPAQKQECVLTAGRLWDEAKNVAVLKHIAPQVLWPIYMAGEENHPHHEPQRHRERTEGGGSSDFSRHVEKSTLDLTPQPHQEQGKGENSKHSQEQERGFPDPVKSKRGSSVHLGHLSSEELATWYAMAAIYALPARYEPFGLSVLEAALSGCALVLGDIPSLREIWGEAAVFVPPDDGEAVAVAINALITNSTRRCQLAKMARDRAVEFTPQRMASGYLKAYQDLIHQRR
jgi:glycosyltransferase involved in cell wall biosynthesis